MLHQFFNDIRNRFFFNINFRFSQTNNFSQVIPCYVWNVRYDTTMFQYSVLVVVVYIRSLDGSMAFKNIPQICYSHIK